MGTVIISVEGLGNTYLNHLPSECPFCHHAIVPRVLMGYKPNGLLHVFMSCPNDGCNQTFIAYYYNSAGMNWTYRSCSQGTIVNREFSETIKSISPAFVKTFNQSYVAEQFKHTEICGVGYRKALEFLIKDYLIIDKPEEKDKIQSKFLGRCIEEYVDDPKIKSVSKRAVWLGNDETHYIRKWEDRDFNDLKVLIELTMHWIEAEHLTNNFESLMPE